MIIHDHKTHNTTLLDFREMAPAGLRVSNQEDLRTVRNPRLFWGGHSEKFESFSGWQIGRRPR